MTTLDEIRYHAGFGAHHSSEALPGALPETQNSPRRPPYGLYAEQISGNPFTVERAHNQRTWLYRIRPALVQSELTPYDHPRLVGDFSRARCDPNLRRWRPLDLPDPGVAVDFVDGLSTFGGAGDAEARTGFAIHLYAANSGMGSRALYNSDGDLLIVPERGGLRIMTELGPMQVDPHEIAVIPRGLRFTVDPTGPQARGYVLELMQGHFRLPERGPIGANGLADERHFLVPTATYVDEAGDWEIINKFGGRLWRATTDRNPYDVVAWHGNHVPYKYDLALFNSMGTVSWDHPDPSILTVLTAPLDDHGNNTVDFVIFPGRWDVAEHTFRPPYYHRNSATEFNGIVSNPTPVKGYDPGCYFLTPTMTPHGVASASAATQYRMRTEVADKPRRGSPDSLWIMFESALGIRLTDWALDADNLDHGYSRLWKDPNVYFDPASRPANTDS